MVCHMPEHTLQYIVLKYSINRNANSALLHVGDDVTTTIDVISCVLLDEQGCGNE